jgi:hypothetical protein
VTGASINDNELRDEIGRDVLDEVRREMHSNVLNAELHQVDKRMKPKEKEAWARGQQKLAAANKVGAARNDLLSLGSCLWWRLQPQLLVQLWRRGIKLQSNSQKLELVEEMIRLRHKNPYSSSTGYRTSSVASKNPHPVSYSN